MKKIISSLILTLSIVVAFSQPVLIVFEEESNSGGKALNSDATTAELAVRNLKIFNNRTRLFEPLHVGVNSLIGHTGFDNTESATLHSWEIGLANMYDSGSFGKHVVYLVKSGQGASEIAHWAPGATGTYGGITVNPWDTLQARVDSAIHLITNATGQAPQIIFWRSQGINDGNAGTLPATWKTRTKADIAKHRVKWGADVCFIITLLTTAYPDLNTKIREVANELPNIRIVNTLDLPLQGDGYHWTYDGQKKIGYRATAATLTLLNFSVSKKIGP